LFRSTNVLSSRFRRIELDREPGLGEIELHDVGTLRKTAADVCFRLAHEITQKRLPRVSLDVVLGISRLKPRP